MTTSITIEELTKHFEGKLTVLSQSLNLFSGIGHEDFPALFSSVDQALDSVREELHLFKLEIDRQNQALLELNELKVSCNRFNGHLQNGLVNIPSILPSNPKPKVVATVVKEDEPRLAVTTGSEKNTFSDQYINFITKDDFNAVPKYMKGRLHHDKVLSVIAKLNEAFADKYKILRQKRSTLSATNRKMREDFISQENKDTKGIHFVVDKDIEHFTSLRMDKTLTNVLVILRHCGVMHEIRGGGFVRFASYC